MNLFKITDIKEFPSDEKDQPLDLTGVPLSLQIGAESDLGNEFDLSDKEYNDIDNISPVIDKQAEDTSELPEDGQYQDEWDESELNEPLDGSVQSPNGDPEMNLEKPEEGSEEPEEDPNFQGIIRTVKGANLVFKRQQEDNTFTELWVMNFGKDMKKESVIKRAILAGTDVDASSQQSQDGKQNVDLTNIGNIQFITISGLPQ